MPFSAWLIPEEKHSGQLQELINRLSQENNSSEFPPHCSLLTQIQNFSAIPIEKIDFFCSYTKTVKLNILNIMGGDTLFKSLYIQFIRDDSILEFQQIFSNLFKNREPYRFDPHLSLMYKIVSAEKQKRIISEISLPDHINFDCISIVNTGEIIEGWEIVHNQKLSE